MLLKFAISDIHGGLDLLIMLVIRCENFAKQAGATALFIFVGDYVDRGPDSAGVISFVRDYQTHHNAMVLRGNHDQMFCDAILRDNPDDWLYNGIRNTARSYGCDTPDENLEMIERLRENQQVLDDCKWIDTLPFYAEDDLRIFVHAGIRPGIPMESQSLYDLIWIRNEFNHHLGRFPKHVVHGHTAHSGNPRSIYNNSTNIDTGALYGGKLTAAVFMDAVAHPIGFLDVDRHSAKHLDEPAELQF